MALAPVRGHRQVNLPARGPSVTPKTPRAGCRGMGWSDSIPIVEGEIGPPRSGFVHRLCIRKADEVWGEAAPTTALRIQDSAEGAFDTEHCHRLTR